MLPLAVILNGAQEFASFKKFVGRGVKDPVNVSSTKQYQGVFTK